MSVSASYLFFIIRIYINVISGILEEKERKKKEGEWDHRMISLNACRMYIKFDAVVLAARPWDRAFRGRTRQWTKCAINVNGERNSSDLLADPKRSDTSLLSASAAAGCRVACIRARTPWRTRNSSVESGTHTCLERKLCSTSSDSPSYGRDRRSVISVDYTIYNDKKVNC